MFQVANNTMQSLVDELAAEIGRAVAIDDPEIQLICASRHYGDEDEQRIRSILQREVGLAAARHILMQGAKRWTSPAVIPPNDDLGMQARWCVPMRHRARLLGLLFVIDAHDTLTDAEKSRIAQAAAAIGTHLYASDLEDSEQRLARERAVEDLLSSDEVVRRTGLQNLKAEDWLAPAVPLWVTVIRVQNPPDTGPRYGITVDRTRACLVETSHHHTAAKQAQVRAEAVIRAVDHLLGAGSRCVAGIGGPVTEPGEAWCAHEQAVIAVNAAAADPSQAVRLWTELGSGAFLSQIPSHAVSEPLLPLPLRRLLDPQQPEWMVDTLRCFLDNAGSTSQTAAALHLHRTSLYYRLDRICEVTGLDLNDGEDRLLLHVGVRLLTTRLGSHL